MKLGAEGREQIRTANPIDAVIREHGVTLRRVGTSLMGLCPFHRDRKPSLSVQVEEGRFHCFGCGESGDVFGFVQAAEKVGFVEAAKSLASRAGLAWKGLCEAGVARGSSSRASRPAAGSAKRSSSVARPARSAGAGRGALRREGGSSPVPAAASPAAPSVPAPESTGAPASVAPPITPGSLLARVVDQYHRVFLARPDAQAYLIRRGLSDPELWRTFRIGYADGSLLKLVGRTGEVREALRSLGVITKEGRELLGGCVVVPLPDPSTGAWVNLYGRGVKTERHCYLPGGLRGVLNYQATRSASEVVLTESVLDALSFHQAGITTAVPLYGVGGFTDGHLDALLSGGCRRVVLCLDNDGAGKKGAEVLRARLTLAGLSVRVASLPAGVKDPNELLCSRNGDAGELMRRLLDAASSGSVSAPVAVDASPTTSSRPGEPPPAGPGASAAAAAAPGGVVVDPAGEAVSAAVTTAPGAPASSTSAAARDSGPGRVGREGDQVSLTRGALSFQARVYPALLGRLRATVRVSRGGSFHVDTIDLLLSKSRTDFSRKTVKALGLDATEAGKVEADLLALLVEAEKVGSAAEPGGQGEPAAMSETGREEALALLRRPDLLDQVVRDAWALGFVGEASRVKLLYLVAVSRLGSQPLSAVILSQSGAGKSVITVVVEQLTPPEHVVLVTRLSPQSLYYTEPGYLDRKLVIIEERHGSQEADYSVRVLQSRGKLVAAAPVKDPQTGNLKTRFFEVVAKAAFIEATTATEVNHENATRCFELTMDESVEQTMRIHERQRFMKTEAGLAVRQQGEAIELRHWNAQRLLEALPVIIPFAEQITFPATWMRTRRDHARFLNLIEASAFVHQYQREKRHGAIVASLADYAVAYELARDVLADTLSDLKRSLREAYESIRALAEKRGGSVTRREIREELGQPDSTVRGWLGHLVELEYLEAEPSKGGSGRHARYQSGARRRAGPAHVGVRAGAAVSAQVPHGEGQQVGRDPRPQPPAAAPRASRSRRSKLSPRTCVRFVPCTRAAVIPRRSSRATRERESSWRCSPLRAAASSRRRRRTSNGSVWC